MQDIEEGKIRKVFSSQMSECHRQRGRVKCFILGVSEIMNLFDDSLWRNGLHRKLTIKNDHKGQIKGYQI